MVNLTIRRQCDRSRCSRNWTKKRERAQHLLVINPLSAGDAFKRIHTVFPQLKFDRN